MENRVPTLAHSAPCHKPARPASGAMGQVRALRAERQLRQHARGCRKRAAMLARTELTECSREGTKRWLTKTT
jgi:hypothetical protein